MRKSGNDDVDIDSYNEYSVNENMKIMLMRMVRVVMMI